ncbi:MAG: septum site-determining protein [Solirubrobacterales bacterium]|nr:septum site-determining protein [Solirubrobacterales bacterium]
MAEACNGRPARDRQRGQAQLELVAGLPLLLLAALISLQLLAVGYAQSLADGAAEAGAIAAADGRDAEDAVLAGLPGWAASRIRVESADGQVEVSLDPPALLPGLGSRLGVSSSAYALPGEQGG